MAEKLKECPFCGDEEIRVIRVGTPAASCIVGCTNCGAELESNEIGSGYYWNDRPQIKEENSNSAEKTQPSGETNTTKVLISALKFGYHARDDGASLESTINQYKSLQKQ